MEFNINNYRGKVAMHCKTAREAREFCDYLHNNGRKWFNGDSYSLKILWSYFEKDTCYIFNNGFIDEICNCRNKGYKILEWSDFSNQFTKKDLRDGMIVEYKSGDLRVVLGNRLVGRDSYNELDLYDDDLTVSTAPNCDIVRVYKGKPRFILDLFNKEYFYMIWERPKKCESVEMTLAEVCNALGMEIKIIK